MAYPISDVPRRIVYSGSAGVGPYAFTFEVLANTDIAVYKNTTLLTLTTDYAVSINTGTGTGTVTLVVAATGSDTVTLVGDRAIQRTSDFVTGGDLFANTLNEELDAQTIYAQQIDEKADRAIKSRVTDPTTLDMTLPAVASRANKLLGFTAGGQPTVSTRTIAEVDAAVGSFVNATGNNAASILYDPPGVTGTAQAGASTTITLASGASTFDDAYNSWRIEITSGTGSGQVRTISGYVGATKVATVSIAWATTPDATSVYNLSLSTTVQAKLRETVSVKDFGAVGDNSTDDTLAFQRAIDYANSVWVGGSQLGGGVTIYIPPGRYKLGALIYKNGVNLQGAGKMHTQLRVFGNNTTLIAASANTATMTSSGNLFYGSWKDFAVMSWDGAGGSTPTGQVGWDAIGFSRWYCENIYFGWGAGFVGIRLTNAILAGSGGPSNWYNTFVGCIAEKHYLGAGGVGLLLGDTSNTKEQITTWNWIGGAVRGSGDGTGTGLNLQSGTGCTFYGVCFEGNGNAVLLGSASGSRFANSIDFIGCYWEGNTVNWNVYAGCNNNGFMGGFQTGGTGTDNGNYTRFSISGTTKAHIQGSSADDYWQVRMLNGGTNRPKFIAAGSVSGFDIVDDLGNNVNLYIAPQTSGSHNYLNAYADGLTDPLWECGAASFSPGDDDTKSLGRASLKWSVVYAATGTISTSDEREKQDIAALDEAEKRVAVALKGLVKKYRFKEAVEKKGNDARIHVGVIAQEVMQAFRVEGLDPMRYGVLCYDKWEAEPAMTTAVVDADGCETGEVKIIRSARPAEDRYGVRYEELLVFIIAAM